MIVLILLCFLVYFAGMGVLWKIQKAKKQKIQDELDRKQEEKERKAEERRIAKDRKEHPEKYLNPLVYQTRYGDPHNSDLAIAQRLQYVDHMRNMSHVYNMSSSYMPMTSMVSQYPATFQTAVGSQINAEADIRRREDLLKILSSINVNPETFQGYLGSITAEQERRHAKLEGLTEK